MRTTAVCAAAAVVLAVGGSVLAGEPISVKLTVQERLGVARTNEPVTSGVPLPEGAVKDVGELSLLDGSGKPVPVQFTAANRWWNDGSAKWVHVDFQASVPANGSATYTLKQGSPKPDFKSPLTVDQKETGVEVDTGPLQFSIHRDSFRLFSTVTLNGKQVVAGGGGIVLQTPQALFRAGERKIVIEEQGPMKVVLLVSGQHVGIPGAATSPDAASYGLDYKLRIYAYANSTRVKVVYTVENRRGKWSDHVDISDWFISLPVERGDGKLTYRLGIGARQEQGDLIRELPAMTQNDGEQVSQGVYQRFLAKPENKDVVIEKSGGQPVGDLPSAWDAMIRDAFTVSGTLTRGEDAARVEVLATDDYRVTARSDDAEKKSTSGNPHKENPPWLGAADLSSSAGGVTVMVRNFWQLWSKYLEPQGNGCLVIGLWTDQVRDKGITTFVDDKGCVQFFAGVARTQEIWFNFHKPDVTDPFAAVAAAREPLFARCDPAWYCQGTKAFGDLSEADQAVYAPQWRAKVEALNRWAEQSVKVPLKRWQTVKAGKNGAVDSYGLLNYGDGVEEANDGQSPDRIHWEGGYYDYPHSIYLQFARTGDPFYLWLATDMSSHNADIHHTHHDAEPGHSRYCPSWGHIIMDEHKAPYASGTFNHWKNLSAFERWYLTGDGRARESAMETMTFAMKLGNDGIDFGQPRSICHGLYGFWAGYDATGEKKYLDAMAKFAKAVAAKIDKGQKMGSGGWQRGMALQGLCWYVERTGDESVVPAIAKSLERDWADNTSEQAYACAFMWKRTGEPKYFTKAVRQLGGKADIWMQRFGNSGRSKLFVPTIVRADAPRKPPATQPD